MPAKNPANKKEAMKELEKTISPILVINNSSLKPYVELFEYSPENIYQQPLGSLVGFFEVKEYSDDSAYIVNFLTSVLKKEYYMNPKRPVAESLDSALHKANMALSELAKQGNVEWLGKLNAAVCVLEKNSAHFSVAGSAKIFLYRGRTLSDVAVGLASDSPEPHPLKTFVNVSSGRLEKGDRMLITQEDIFHIFPAAELRKNFQRFEGDKFVQFLKTALSNRMEMIAATIVEVTETETVKETRIAASRKKTAVAANVFSEKTFADARKPADAAKKAPDSEATGQKSDSEYTDTKTGHIYVQGETAADGENIQANIYWDITKEKIAQLWYASKNDVRRRFSLFQKQLAKKRELGRIEKEKRRRLAAEEKKHERERKALEDLEREQRLALEKERERKIREAQELERRHEERLAREKAQLDRRLAEEENLRRQESEAARRLVEEVEEVADAAVPDETSAPAKELSFLEKLALARKQSAETGGSEENMLPEETSSAQAGTAFIEMEERSEQAPAEKNNQLLALKASVLGAAKKAREAASGISESSLSAAQKISGKMKLAATGAEKAKTALLPHFSKIGKLFAAFTPRQKRYAVAALAVIVIAPVFINRWTERPQPKTITELAAVVPPTPAQTLSGEKNMDLNPQKRTVLSENGMIAALPTGSGTAVVMKTGITVLKDGQRKEYPLPADSGTSVNATFMRDLSLVLVMTDRGKVVSFSPVSLKFIANNIDLPDGFSKDPIGTYLTYLYVLDPSAGQIYRYPRANGGFGAKTDWLKDKTELSQASAMAIDDSIYVVRGDQVVKLFKGKAQPFTLETSQTPVRFDKIFTTVDSASLYVLDTKNARLVQYAKNDGAIIAQYSDAALAGGISLSVDEQNKTAYIATSSELISLSLR